MTWLGYVLQRLCGAHRPGRKQKKRLKALKSLRKKRDIFRNWIISRNMFTVTFLIFACSVIMFLVLSLTHEAFKVKGLFLIAITWFENRMKKKRGGVDSEWWFWQQKKMLIVGKEGGERMGHVDKLCRNRCLHRIFGYSETHKNQRNWHLVN